MSAMDCRPGATHQWAASGWCVRGCGVRQDGRVVSRQGQLIIPGPDQPNNLPDGFRDYTERIAR